MTDEDRYSYYLLSHMFNELMCLQKLIVFTMPRHDEDWDFRRRPELAQSALLFRLALSKIYEVKDELAKNSQIKKTFDSLIFPQWMEGRSSQQELFEKLDAASWLGKLRNKVGFHFPTFSQLTPFIQPNDDWDDDLIYMSEASGNVFYDSANAVVMHWMFSMYGKENSADAIDPMIREMIDIIGCVTSYLENSLGFLIARSMLTDRNVREPCGTVDSQRFDEVHIPFWTTMSSGDINNG